MVLLWFAFLCECRLLILAILHIVYDRNASSTSIYIIYILLWRWWMAFLSYTMCNILITVVTTSSFIIIIVMMISIAFIINEDIITNTIFITHCP